MSIKSSHAFCDDLMASLRRKSAASGRPFTCAKGCSHCCYEPVFATRDEVVAMLAGLPLADRAVVVSRLPDWLMRFREADLGKVVADPPAGDNTGLMRYRAVRLPCPFLDQAVGLCRAYARRPVSCRTHVACGPVSKCRDDAERPKQIFVTTQDDAYAHAAALASEGKVAGECIEMDHLGVLAAQSSGLHVQSTEALAIYKFE